jgi:hypothetical protein
VAAIILEMMVASMATVATGIKEVGQLSSCLVLLYVRHHLSFQSTSNRWWKDSMSLGLTNLDLPKELL